MICNVRVDDRLLHGQVLHGWVSKIGLDQIVVCDDEIAADPGRQMMMKLSVTQSLEVSFYSVAQLAQIWSQFQESDVRVMVLVRLPDTVDALLTLGTPIVRVTLGNINEMGCKKALARTIRCKPGRQKMFEAWQQQGVEIEVCSGAFDDPKQLESPCTN